MYALHSHACTSTSLPMPFHADMVAADVDKRAGRHAVPALPSVVGRPSRSLVASAAFLLLSIPILFYAASDTVFVSTPRLGGPHTVTAATTLPSPSPANSTTLMTPTALSVSWADSDLPPNYTSALLARWLDPGGPPCRESLTANVTIPGLDGFSRLRAGEAHEFVVRAVDERGTPRCLGGDYFEADLAGERWRSRPPMRDRGDGTYTLTLQVHPQFSGFFNFTMVLLFRRHEGLKLSTERFAMEKELRRVGIEFYRKEEEVIRLPELKVCGVREFAKGVWAGRWTRHKWKGECEVDGEGRYRCMGRDVSCEEPWCYGDLGSLESNGWVYSTHCAFRLFSQEEAWSCLNNRWWFFWGDSNHVDTIRNLLNFVLGLTDVKSVPRRFDQNFTDPSDPSRSVRITSLFNGHWNGSLNYEGLNSLHDPSFRSLLLRYLVDPPDFMIINSGLHDGIKWPSPLSFINAADRAVAFFEDVFQKWGQEGKRRPPLFYRTTVAAGGYARRLSFNPSKMEVFNGVMVEKLRGLMQWGGGVIDHFDMTFPWHFNNRCNDGVHYGRAPAKAKWRDGEIGHQYFVDLMLGHVLLNAICNHG